MLYIHSSPPNDRTQYLTTQSAAHSDATQPYVAVHNQEYHVPKSNDQQGFTLIELMVTVAIIGILASVALPNYTNYIKKGKAAEATSTLADLRVKMEQYYQDNRTYVGGPCTPAAGTTQHFNYACTVQTDTAYTLSATNAAADMAGFAFSVNQNNAKTSTYDGTSGNCWLTKKGGAC